MQYIATIRNVHEIGVEGAADPAPWVDHLRPLGLTPVITEGMATVYCNTLSARWMGVRFREAIVAVAVVASRSGTQIRGVYLDVAFQSSSLFAFIERHRFRTGFEHAAIETSLDDPAGFSVRSRGEPTLQAAATPDGRPTERDDMVWEEPIYLPSSRSKERGRRDVFHARISGESTVNPFDPAVDRFEIECDGDRPGLRRLRDSGFRPVRWRTRPSSVHSRSGTSRERIEPLPE